MFFVLFLSVVFMFSPSLFKLLHLQSTKTHIKTLNTPETLEGKHKKQKKQKSPSQTLRDIYFSRRFVGWKYCISVLFNVFLRVFMFFCLCFFLLLLFYVFA